MRTVIMICIGLWMSSPAPAASAAPSKVASKPGAQDSTKRKAAREGWPDTPAGEVAGGWVDAFSAGEDAMRAFLLKNLTEEAFTRRSMSKRLETYRASQERFGTLTLVSVDKASPGEIKATLMAADASAHTFIFNVQTDAPHRLVSVSMLEMQGHGHGGFGH